MLFRVHDASGWQLLWKLRLPHAVPQLVAGAQASGGLAVVGAIAGEVFAGYGAEKSCEFDHTNLTDASVKAPLESTVPACNVRIA